MASPAKGKGCCSVFGPFLVGGDRQSLVHAGDVRKSPEIVLIIECSLASCKAPVAAGVGRESVSQYHRERHGLVKRYRVSGGDVAFDLHGDAGVQPAAESDLAVGVIIGGLSGGGAGQNKNFVTRYGAGRSGVRERGHDHGTAGIPQGGVALGSVDAADRNCQQLRQASHFDAREVVADLDFSQASVSELDYAHRSIRPVDAKRPHLGVVV